MELREQKKILRRQLLEQAAGLEREYCERADREIASRLFLMPEYRKAEVLFCFAGTEREIDTRPVILNALKQGKRVGVPKCVGKGIMEVREIKGLWNLEPGKYGIMEPASDCPLIIPEEIDLCLIPCLSASVQGVRLGYGGGYYDRYLPFVRGTKAVLCRRRMMCQELPGEEHDVGMDMVVSEDGAVRMIAGRGL